MSKHIGVFWDLDNTHWSILSYYGSLEEPLIKIVNKVWEQYYTEIVRVFRAYADFEKIKNVQTEIQKKRVTPKHVFSSNTGSDNRKNAADIELSLDALETVFKCPDVETYVIISADRDMIPLMNRLKYYGKKVHLIYLEAAIADDKLLLDFCDESTSIESIVGIEISAKEDPISQDLENLAEDAKEVVRNFYVRNADKPHLFLGQRMFVDDMVQKKKISGNVASKLLDYCLEKGHLKLEEQPGNKPKKVVTNEVFTE